MNHTDRTTTINGRRPVFVRQPSLRPGLSEPNAAAVRALEMRHATARAVNPPGHWLLDSPQLGPVVAMARRLAAAATTPVMIQGERGSGLRELARLIHHEDAVAREGRFRAISAPFVGPSDIRAAPFQGTLFIEDVEGLSPAGQDWIAELLDERTSAPRPLRVIASSRFGVDELLQQSRLGQELLVALDGSRLTVPPLRDRPAEIAGLARRFLAHHGRRLGRPLLRFSTEAERKLLHHAYPGNVCELRNVVERAVALRSDDLDEIGGESILFYDEAPGATTLDEAPPPGLAAAAARIGRYPSLAELERDYLVLLIRELRGRRTAISRAMGVSYPTVLKKIARHRLDVRAIVAAASAAGRLDEVEVEVDAGAGAGVNEGIGG